MYRRATYRIVPAILVAAGLLSTPVLAAPMSSGAPAGMSHSTPAEHSVTTIGYKHMKRHHHHRYVYRHKIHRHHHDHHAHRI
jgi:hypothetical protein